MINKGSYDFCNNSCDSRMIFWKIKLIDNNNNNN